MKLSNAQQHVIDRMKQGWQLGNSMTIGGRFWIQSGGCGSGGPSEDVNANTVQALVKRRLIDVDKQKFPTCTWKLTKRGIEMES